MDKGKIYKITNKVNGKSYIGCTIYSLEKRFQEHVYRCFKTDINTKLYNSIRKYGIENFSIELLEECDVKEIYKKENDHIIKYDTFKNGLNSTLGGEGCLGYTHSKEIRKKISKILKNGASHKGKTYEKIYGENAEIEKQKRKERLKEYWDNIDESEKTKRMKNVVDAIRLKSKYPEHLIKEIKEKLKHKKVTDVSKEYPEIKTSYLYSIKSGKRWNNI